MPDPDVFAMVGFAIMIGLFAVMLLVGIPRGRSMQKTDEQIDANQRRLAEIQERQIAAKERIADALENRG